MSSAARLSKSLGALSKYLIDCISAGELSDGLTDPKLIKLGQAAWSITVFDRKQIVIAPASRAGIRHWVAGRHGTEKEERWQSWH